jgi:hypothetical protein
MVFANSLTNDFVWDDNELIVNNPAVHSLSDVSQFFSGHFWSQSSQPSARGYYRPLVLLSYAADYRVWGARPFGFHLTNVLWHALAAALVCALLMRLTSSPAASLAAGALFAALPVHVESVAFISGRTDVIATVFLLLSTQLFLNECEHRTITFRLPLSVLFFVFALLSKEVAVVLPVLFLTGEISGMTAGTEKKRVLAHASYWVMLALYLVVRFGLLTIHPELQGKLSTKEVLFTMPVVAADYIRLLVIPINLCADYAVSVQRNANAINIAILISWVLACVGIGILILRKRMMGFLAAWIVISLLPVLQIIPISVLKAERFLYLPSVGYCALGGCGLRWVYERIGKSSGFAMAHGRRLLITAFGLIVLGFSLQTLARNKVWKDELTLYRVTESCAPDNFRVQYNLGNAYFRSGDVNRALQHTLIAFRLQPDFPQVSYNLGVIYESMGSREDAEKMYRKATELDPAYAIAHNNLAAILYAEGRFGEAQTEWSKAVSLDPGLEQARQGLSLLDHSSTR